MKGPRHTMHADCGAGLEQLEQRRLLASVGGVDLGELEDPVNHSVV